MGSSTILDTLLATPNSELIVAEYHKKIQEEKSKLAEFMNLIHENMKAEFINGEIVMHSPVMKRHWVVSNKITTRISLFVDQHHLGIVGSEKVMIDCSRNKYEPDIVFFSTEKAARFEDNQLLFPPPDFIIEILSDSTRQNDYHVKFQDYAAHGVSEYWIVDPEIQTIEQFILKGDHFELLHRFKHNDHITSQVIKGFELNIGAIWG
jgi:Uma2 family endonuclease